MLRRLASLAVVALAAVAAATARAVAALVSPAMGYDVELARFTVRTARDARGAARGALLLSADGWHAAELGALADVAEGRAAFVPVRPAPGTRGHACRNTLAGPLARAGVPAACGCVG